MQSHHGGATANADPAPSRDETKTKQRRFPRRAAASGDVSLGEAASDRPEAVAECWQLADATCARLGDAKRRAAAAAAKARRGWKTIRLFLSFRRRSRIFLFGTRSVGEVSMGAVGALPGKRRPPFRLCH